MTDKTELKILDAALKIFAKKGYDAATTRVIAEESGYTEMTLFRKFGTKKNLFDQVMTQGVKKMQEQAYTELFIDKEFKDPRSFLEAYIKNFVEFSNDNFEIFHLTFTENSSNDSVQRELIAAAGDYVEKNLPDKRIDYRTFGISIASFIYILNLEKYHGRTKSFGDEEKILENFIDLLYCSINH